MNSDALRNDVSIVQGVANHDHAYTTDAKQHFTFHEEKLTWMGARMDCMMRGGNLASIHSDEENAEVYAITGGDHDAWIGLFEADEHVWMWADGSLFDYDKWHTDTPNTNLEELYCS